MYSNCLSATKILLNQFPLIQVQKLYFKRRLNQKRFQWSKQNAPVVKKKLFTINDFSSIFDGWNIEK